MSGQRNHAARSSPPAARHRSCAPTGESGQLPIAEEAHVVWSALRGSRLGIPFRRQVVITRYIADFACREARLIVEVDGEVHARRQLDAHRDAVLQRAGYRVLRIPAALITSNLTAAVALVRDALAG